MKTIIQVVLVGLSAMWVLAGGHQQAWPWKEQCRQKIVQSLSAAERALYTFEAEQNRLSGSLGFTERLAMQDCLQMLQLTQQALSATYSGLSASNTSENGTWTAKDAAYYKSWVSAVQTNAETCLESLSEAGLDAGKYNFTGYLSSSSKLSGDSLAFMSNVSVIGGPGRRGSGNRGRAGRRRLLRDANGGFMDGFGEFAKEGFPAWLSADDRRRFLEDTGVAAADVITVAQDGSGNFTTVTEAINAAPNKSSERTVIYVTAGVYYEYVQVPKTKTNLMLIGDGINVTVISGNRSVADGWTTFNSATFATVGSGFLARDITFENTAGPEKHQAVALRVGSDLSAFYRCSFKGYQDTLYTHSLRQFYRECDIYGTVDFIFGNAAVVFQKCNLYARAPMTGQSNVFTAQGRTDPNQNTGTSIHNCTVTADADLAASNGTFKTYLGRPWKEYSRTVYMQSFLDSLIDPAGWLAWNGTFALSTLYYGEFNNSGPGSPTNKRVTWDGYHLMNVTEAQNFTVSNFIVGDAWLPDADVTYDGGLL